MNIAKLYLLLGTIVLLATTLLGCQKKKQELEAEIAELKVVLAIRPSACFVSYEVTKGEDPYIYRDGNLVSQGDYISTKEQTDSYTQTTFHHRGERLKVTVRMTSYFSYMYATPSIQANIYRNGTKVSSFSRSYELRPRQGSVTANFEVSAQTRQ